MRSVILELAAVTSLLVAAGAIAGCGGTATPEPWENGTGSSSSGSGSGSGGSSGASTSSGGSGSGASSGAASSSSGSSSGGSTSSGGGTSSGGSSGASGSGSSGASSGSGSGSSGGAPDGGTASSSGGGDGGGGSSGGVTPGFDQFQQHNLDVINQYRATLSLPPLQLDKQLSTFALAGSNELTQDHTPHQHFITAGNDGTLWSSGFTSSAGENQGDPNGWPKAASDPTQNELTQIDQIQKAMFDEGPGTGEAHGHYENMMSTTFKRVGVGLVEVGSSLYLTNDFSN